MKAEIRNLSMKGGHYYLKLAEKEEDTDKVIARCTATIFRSLFGLLQIKRILYYSPKSPWEFYCCSSEFVGSLSLILLADICLVLRSCAVVRSNAFKSTGVSHMTDACVSTNYVSVAIRQE